MLKNPGQHQIRSGHRKLGSPTRVWKGLSPRRLFLGRQPRPTPAEPYGVQPRSNPQRNSLATGNTSWVIYKGPKGTTGGGRHLLKCGASRAARQWGEPRDGPLGTTCIRTTSLHLPRTPGVRRTIKRSSPNPLKNPTVNLRALRILRRAITPTARTSQGEHHARAHPDATAPRPRHSRFGPRSLGATPPWTSSSLWRHG